LLEALFLEGEPNWDNNSRKICEFGNNVLLNMDGCTIDLITPASDFKKCCYLNYWERFNMNKLKRNEVFEKLIKNKRYFRHSRLFTESRILTISEIILQTVKKTCSTSNDSCKFPANYDFTMTNSDYSDSLNSESSIDRISEIDMAQELTLPLEEEIIEGGTCLCPNNSTYPVGARFKINDTDCNTEKQYCIGGVFTCEKSTKSNDEQMKNEIKCGELNNAIPEIHIGIMTDFDDFNESHYYNREFKTRFK